MDKHGSETKWTSPLPVVLATGFSLSASSSCVLQGLSDWDDTGRPVLDVACDEVMKTKGIFVVGPMVKHIVDVGQPKDGGTPTCGKAAMTPAEMIQPETVIFCFIYKFRCRFALVAGEIMSRLIEEHHAIATSKELLTLDDEGRSKLKAVDMMVRKWKEKGMLTTDLSCAVCGKLEGSC